jgi:hypothetical protein
MAAQDLPNDGQRSARTLSIPYSLDETYGEYGQLRLASCQTGPGVHTWKFFSAHPFLARARTTTSASNSSTTPSTHSVISSSAANRVFQLASPRSSKILDGIRSPASASASSGRCLYLKVSRAAAAAAGADTAPPLEGFDTGAAAGTIFLTAGAAGFLVWITSGQLNGSKEYHLPRLSLGLWPWVS